MNRNPTQVSSLPLQVLIYFHQWYVPLYLVLSLITFIYKGIVLPFPSNVLGAEIFGFLAYCALEEMRLFLGSKGNKTQQVGPMIQFFIVGVCSLIVTLYYMLWQTYILRLDLIINVTALIFIGLELLLGLISTCVFWQHRRFI